MITEAQRLAEHNLKTLSENDYPGRGIVLGRFDQDHWGYTGLWGGAQTVVTDV